MHGERTGAPEKYCAANFWGRGQTNATTLKRLLANAFCCVVCLDDVHRSSQRDNLHFKTVSFLEAVFLCARRAGRESAFHAMKSAIADEIAMR